ncbi:MAG: MmgE/PrpD family protein [Chloroflexi bacterium]|nr:MmgE/PrpD family protein [Chloroflexota bacterium]
MVHVNDPTAQLCEWACSTSLEDIPADVRKETVTLIYDAVGGMLASSRLPTCTPVVDMVKAMGGNRDCTIVGHPVKTSVTYAALANGTIGQGDEVDATGQHGSGHFAAVTVSVAMSVGQYIKASGKEVVRALAIGSEAAARVNSALAEAFGYRYSHFQSSVIGSPLGAALVAGVLLKLNKEQMEHALALTAYQIGGLNCFFQDPTHQSKSLQYGIAAQGAVAAGLLAQRGFHGPPSVLTSEHGFFDAFTDYAGMGNHVVKDLGQNYFLRQTAFKRYPVGGPDQAPLHAFLSILRQSKVNADDIDQVEVTMSRNSFITLATLKHPSVYLPTILSLAAIFGEVTFRHIHEATYFQDKRVEAFKERIKLLPQPETGSRLETTVRVRTKDGKLLSERLRYPLMDEKELQAKFRYLAGLRVDEGKVLDLEKKFKGIEVVANVSPLIEELGIA